MNEKDSIKHVSVEEYEGVCQETAALDIIVT